MLNKIRLLKLLLEDENVRIGKDIVDLGDSDDADFFHSVFTNCFIDWTREDLLSCFDENTELYTANDYANNYFVKCKGELRYGSIIDPYSVFIASDVTFLDDYFNSGRFRHLIIINSKALINNPLTSGTISIGESSEVNIINKTGSKPEMGRNNLDITFYQNTASGEGNRFNMTSEIVDDVLEQIDITFFSECFNSKALIDLEKYSRVKRVNVSYGDHTKNNIVELVNMSKSVEVNMYGDGSYRNKTIVNGKLDPYPTYLAC